MEIAVQEAYKGLKRNDGGPFGAVIVQKDIVLARTHNMVIRTNDPTAHAEIVAIRNASKKLNRFDLSDCEIYSTCEPCPMCTSLAVWSNLTTIVFGASIEETSKLGRSRINMSSREIVDKSPAMIEIIEGEMKKQCLKLYAY